YSSLLHSCRPHRLVHAFPTRRSSDLREYGPAAPPSGKVKDLLTRLALLLKRYELQDEVGLDVGDHAAARYSTCPPRIRSYTPALDRKSTRLNSSHVKISYAVFCLKKK